MAKARLSMRKLREVLRLKFDCALSGHQIAHSCKITQGQIFTNGVSSIQSQGSLATSRNTMWASALGPRSRVKPIWRDGQHPGGFLCPEQAIFFAEVLDQSSNLSSNGLAHQF